MITATKIEVLILVNVLCMQIPTGNTIRKDSVIQYNMIAEEKGY